MASPREAVSETALSLTRAGQDQEESSELSRPDQVQPFPDDDGHGPTIAMPPSYQQAQGHEESSGAATQ